MVSVSSRQPNSMGEYDSTISELFMNERIPQQLDLLTTNFAFANNTHTHRETNLKCRQSLTETAALSDNIEALASFDGKQANQLLLFNC